MKQLLINLLGADGCASPGCPTKANLQSYYSRTQGPPNVTIINYPDHVPFDSPLIGPKGALIIEEDINHDLKVDQADSDHFFVIGLIRRPCDYMVSYWSEMSASTHGTAREDSRVFGMTPPYNNTDDRTRFETWVNDTAKMRDAGKSHVEGAYFMSVALADRVPSPEKNVHCWVRTHLMRKDLRACMEQFEGCGGNVVWEALAEDRFNEALETAQKSNPWGEHATCQDVFTSGTRAWATVMETEKDLISDYDLGKCCS